MKQTGIKRRLTALLLSVCLLSPAAALPVSAKDAGNTTGPAYEDMSQRGENTKVFRQSNNTYVAVTSGTPMHFKQNGRWTEIDNTLKAKKNGAGKTVLANQSNPYTVELPERLSSSDAVTLRRDGYALSFTMLDIEGASRTAQVAKQTPQKGASDTQKRAKLEKRSSSLIYRDVQKDTSVQYIVGAKQLKENILLEKAPASQVQYRYRLAGEGLSAQLQKDGSVRLTGREKQDVFFIPAPVMTDYRHQSSTDVHTSLAENEDGTYTLTYTPSLTWLQEGERAYPVAVDPAVTLQRPDGGSAYLEDTFTDSSAPKENFYQSDVLTLGSYQGTTNDLYFLPNSAMLIMMKKNIIRASVTFHQAGYFRFEKNALAGLYQVTSKCSISDVTYESRPQTEDMPIDCAKIREDYLKFDVTGYINNYFNGAVNQPLAVKVLNGSGIAWYDSDEAVDAANTPVQEVEYTYPTGTDTRYDSHSWDMGRAGVAKLNDFSGFFTLTRDEIGIADGRFPVNIRRIYNTGNASLSLERILDGVGFQSQYGGYWSTNYDRRLVYLSSEPQIFNEPRYAYGDGDDSWYYFTDTGRRENGYELWESDASPVNPGKRFTLYVPEGTEDRTNYGSARIHQEDGTVVSFNAQGRMVKLQEPADPSHSINIQYGTESSGTAGYITKITDGEQREYRFTYKDSRLASIACYAPDGSALTTTGADGQTVPLAVTYTYKRSGSIMPHFFLSDTTYPDGTKVAYGNSTVLGDVFSFITQVTDPQSGRRMNITNRDTYQVSRIELQTPIGEDGAYRTDSSLDWEYMGTRQVVITDETGRSQLKRFDESGQTVSVYEVREDDFSLIYQRFSDGTVYEKVDKSNILENSSFENGLQGWQTSGLAMGTGDQAHGGSQSLMLINSASVTTVAHGVYPRYRFSTFLKTPDGVTDIGASITVESMSANGTVIDSKTSPLVANTGGQWQELSLTCDVPQGTALLHARLNTSGSGILYADDLSLCAVGEAMGENLLQNPDFTTDFHAAASPWSYEGGAQADWVDLNDNGIDYSPLEPMLDSHVAAVAGTPGGLSRIRQTVAIHGSAGERFAFGSWAMGFSASLRDSRTFGMRVEAPKEDGSGMEVLGEFSFNPYISSGQWQYGTDCFTLDRPVEEVTVTLLVDYQPNGAIFDGVSLCRIEG